MAEFSDITVVSVTGWQPAAIGAALSVQLSANELPGSRALLISPERPAHMPPWIQHVAVQPFGYMEYSLFMLYLLHQFIDTEYALIVQDDGWVVSGRNWKPQYFDCDYVGAPVHLARVRQGSQRGRGQGRDEGHFLRGFAWCDEARKPGVEIDPIFNGGFSLRSQRLMRAPQALKLPVQIPPPLACDLSSGQPARMAWENDVVLEDVWLCISAREALEAHGVKFASIELGRSFAIEHASPILHDGFPMQDILGHHSKFRKIVRIAGATPTLRYTIPREAAASIFGENAIQQMFLGKGWRIEWPDSVH